MIFSPTWHHAPTFTKPSIFLVSGGRLRYVVGLVVSIAGDDTPESKSAIADGGSDVIR